MKDLRYDSIEGKEDLRCGMEKEKQVLMILQEQDDWVTTDVLANLCHVSTRTIRKYVASINTENQYILSSTAGYRFNRVLAHPMTQEVKQTLESSNDRIRYILQKLLHENGTIDRYDLCDEMYISTSTLKNDLQKVKESLSEYDLYLHQKGDTLWCDGLEKNRRKMVSSLLYKESNARFMNDELIKTTFAHLPVLQIKQELITIFRKFHYFSNDYNLSNLLLHLCISVDRIQNGCGIATDLQFIDQTSVEFQIAIEVSAMLESLTQCTINQVEINELALLIISRSSHIDSATLSSKTYAHIVNEEEQAFLQTMLQRVNDTYYVDLNNEHFLTRFSLHLHNLLIRTHTRYLARNNLTKEMKMNFPLIYDIAVFFANMIEEYTHTKINEDEIAYIALHIGSNIDEKTNESKKINVVVLCPQYYDLEHHLIQKIEQHFQNDLLITHLITKEEELAELPYQALISTYRPLSPLTQPCLIVHPLLTQKDIATIEKFIREEKGKLKHHMLKRHLHSVFPEALFLCDEPFKTREEAIQGMCTLLQTEGVVEEGFYTEIMEREVVSSTAFDHFAIPHSLKMNANKTCVCTSIHHRVVDWNHHQVNFIFMIAVNHLERKRFKDIFSSLTDVLIDPTKLSSLLKVSTYHDFIEVLSDLL